MSPMLSSILQQCNYKTVSLTLQYISPILDSIPFYLSHRKFTATTSGSSSSISIIIIKYYQLQQTTFCSHAALWSPKILASAFILLKCSHTLKPPLFPSQSKILLLNISKKMLDTPDYHLCNKYPSIYCMLETKDR